MKSVEVRTDDGRLVSNIKQRDRDRDRETDRCLACLAKMSGMIAESLRVSALLSAPRCDTTQLLFIPIRLAPIWVIHSGYADPRPRPKCTPQCLLGRRTRKNGVFRLLSCFPVSFSYSVYLIMEIVACFFWLVLLSIRLLLFHKRFQLR